MIQFEILKSIDQKRQGTYIFHKDFISLGKSVYDDALFDQESLIENHFFLIIEKDSLMVHLNEKTPYILINGKRTTASKRLKSNDKIEAGSIELKILSFSNENDKGRKEYLNQRVEEIKKTSPELIPILQSLNEDI